MFGGIMMESNKRRADEGLPVHSPIDGASTLVKATMGALGGGAIAGPMGAVAGAIICATQDRMPFRNPLRSELNND